MNRRLKKILLLLLAAALLYGNFHVQNALNRDREKLDLTRVQPLENAPPLLAFTTVALGGFRGLISNMLWIRASEMQQDDKFFEMAQLSDWITKLEPHFVQVWIFQAWNMAYNISVKFKENGPGVYSDRWRWVRRGIELLRDEGLRYNPNEILLYRELGGLFQHKLGAATDDANMYYKQQWADQMAEVFGKMQPANFEELIHPGTDEQRQRAAVLRDKFKMDPHFMREVDQRYGPLEWRLPEAHAIYWAALGLDEARRNPTKVKREDLITLRRMIYQSLLLAFARGRLEINPVEKVFEFGPNLDVIPRLNDIYEQSMADEPDNRNNISTAHRNFLRQAIYSLYVNDRMADAAKWFKYLGDKYPDKPILDKDPNSLPRTLTLDQYAVTCVEEDINDLSHDRVKLALEGLLGNAYRNLVLDREERYTGFVLLARKVWENFQRRVPAERMSAIGLPPFDQIQRDVLNQMLDPINGVPAQARAILRTRLNLGPETPPTNAPAAGGAAGS